MWSRVKLRDCGWACVVGALAVLAGCGKSTSNSTGAIPQSELVARVADIVCEGRAQCCKNGGISLDVAACKQRLVAQLQDDLMEQRANVVYDPVAAGECLDDAAAKAECGRLEDDDAPACERVFQGTLALGARCEGSEECRASAGQRVICASPDDVAPRVCTLLESSSSRHGKLGEACNATCSSNSCAGISIPAPATDPSAPSVDPAKLVTCYRVDGLYCDFDSGACAKLVSQGGACSTHDACAAGSFCDFSTQTCSVPRADGSACNDDDECRSGNCHYDADGAGRCVAKGTLSADECTVSGGDIQNSSESPPP